MTPEPSLSLPERITEIIRDAANKVPRPAVVFVRDGEARPVIRRETHDDLLRLDL